ILWRSTVVWRCGAGIVDLRACPTSVLRFATKKRAGDAAGPRRRGHRMKLGSAERPDHHHPATDEPLMARSCLRAMQSSSPFEARADIRSFGECSWSRASDAPRAESCYLGTCRHGTAHPTRDCLFVIR